MYNSAGSQPRLKYFIEKETDDTVVMEAVLTLYDGTETVGINLFNVSLQQNINIDYFTVEPEKANKVINKIELKDIYIDGKKYSISKTFNVKVEN